MEVTLRADARTETGKGFARRARASGRVPAVLYGSSVEPTSLFVDHKQMKQALRTEAGANVLINLLLDGDSKFLTIPREIQTHPIRGDILHVDFVNVARDVQINADVPVHLVGESHGVKEGGQIDQHAYEVHVLALPTDIPAGIDVDITELGIGDSIKVADLNVPEGVEILNDPEEPVVGVIEPTVMEVEAPEEEVAAVEGEEAPQEDTEGEASGEGSQS